MSSALVKGYFTPYYLTHGALVLSYGIIRTLYPDASIQRPSTYFPGVTNEVDFGMFGVILILQKLRRSSNWGDFWEAAIQYAELTVLAFTFLSARDVFACYVVAFLLARAMLRRPSLTLGTHVVELTPYDVDEIRRPAAPGKVSAVRWLVLVGNRRADTILPDFLAVARRNCDASCRFGYVDLSCWPAMAVPMEVDTTMFSAQVPSIIEVGPTGAIGKRLPFLDEEGDAKYVKIDSKAIIIHFGVKA